MEAVVVDVVLVIRKKKWIQVEILGDIVDVVALFVHRNQQSKQLYRFDPIPGWLIHYFLQLNMKPRQEDLEDANRQ